METTQENNRQIRSGPSSPVTPKDRAISVNLPPGAPRRVVTRRRLAHRHDGSCCVHKSPQMHPSAFARLLRASPGSVGPDPGLAPSGPAPATGTPAGFEVDAHMRLAVPSTFEPSGFVVGFTEVEHDPFFDSPTGSSQPRDSTSSPVTVTSDALDETCPSGDSEMRQCTKEGLVKFLGLVAAAFVVAADVLAASSDVRETASTTPAVSTGSREGEEDI